MNSRRGFSCFLLALSLLIATACAGSPSQPAPAATRTPTPQASAFAPTAEIGGQVFRLEIADTPEERAKGLSRRRSLPADVAMLFIFEQESPWAFWMKDTLIPLDILWLDSSGRIVDVQTMQPEPGKSDAELTIYLPKAPAKYALEMNAGLAGAYGFAPGMQVGLSLAGR